MVRLALVIILSLFLMPSNAEPNQSITVPFGYFEPTTNADGTALEDLSHIELYLESESGDILVATIPASSEFGGEEIAQDVTVGLPMNMGQLHSMPFHAVAVDTSGNKSAPGETFNLPMGFVAQEVVKKIVECPKCETCEVCQVCEVCEVCEDCKPCPDVMTKVISECNCGINACRCIQQTTECN